MGRAVSGFLNASVRYRYRDEDEDEESGQLMLETEVGIATLSNSLNDRAGYLQYFLTAIILRMRISDFHFVARESFRNFETFTVSTSFLSHKDTNITD